MVKNKESVPAEADQKPVAEGKKTGVKGFLVRLVLWALLLGALYGLWRNPQIATNLAEMFAAQTATEEEVDENAAATEDLYRQIAILQNQVRELNLRQADQNYAPSGETVDLSRFEEKFEAIEKQNLNVINSKADVATVLGIVNRLDKIEERLDTLAKISDDGALVLTAVMMVKECADAGTNFVYEAEILQQLAQNEKALAPDVATIVKYAREGVKPQSNLTARFRKIYRTLTKVQQQQDLERKSWKERLNMKLNEIVKVKRVNDMEYSQADLNADLKKANELVKQGELVQALAVLHSLDPELLKNADLTSWVNDAQAKIEFNQAIANISAHSLALMKVNSIKKTVQDVQ